MNPSQIKNIFWDVDGVLADLNYAYYHFLTGHPNYRETYEGLKWEQLPEVLPIAPEYGALELKTHPRRKRGKNNPAPWEQIMQAQRNVFKKHPQTNFIAAHMAWMANDLGGLSQVLDEIPNMHVGIGAIIAELGRQPRMANWFFEKHQDRVLFGKDSYKTEEFPTYFRVLESSDEYFPYYKRYHAFWRMYGLALPDEILKKLYYKNALRIIPGLDASLFPK